VFTPGLRVLGVEIDADRVGNAYAASIPGRLEFRFGGFDIPMAPGERASVVRAINVLRGCDEPRHHEAVNRLGRALRDGGVLMEGTGSPTGRLLAVSLYRRRGARLAREGLLLAPNLARDWTPRELQAVLPRDLIDHSGPGSWLDDFFERWDKCVTAARAPVVLVSRLSVISSSSLTGVSAISV